jgi:hypothetical protein
MRAHACARQAVHSESDWVGLSWNGNGNAVGSRNDCIASPPPQNYAMVCDVAAIEGGKRVVMRGTLPRIIDHITEAETDRPTHSAPPVTRIALRCTVASWVLTHTRRLIAVSARRIAPSSCFVPCGDYPACTLLINVRLYCLGAKLHEYCMLFRARCAAARVRALAHCRMRR